MNEAQIIGRGLLHCQVCVPANWSDVAVERFVEQRNPCGTTAGWCISSDDAGSPVRVPCDERPEFVHIVLRA